MQKEEFESLNKKLKELSKDELKLATGGNDNEYRYSFKQGDFVYSTVTKDEWLLIQENVKTNDSSYKVKCEKINKYPTRISSLDELIRYVSCSNLMMMYQQNGGKFYS